MTATTSPSATASPSEPPETEKTGTGPAGSKAASHSSSTPETCLGHAAASGAAQAAQPHDKRIEQLSSGIAQRLRHLRTSRGWTVYDVERVSGVSRSTLSRIERQVTDPTMPVLARVCWAYGCSLSRLLAEVETQPEGDDLPS
ncbi:helix-turn-helix domain-containing protein [Streptomyces coeruleorubidus]|uniref:helix-turn-helix domain-containing protein n=1 Tax=Streptomyces coeruleorubidus TaxID=116188 RepID=UPI0033B13487